MKIEIPEKKSLEIKHLVFDYNGTIAIDGCLIEGICAKMKTLSKDFDIHVVTADTFGEAAKQLTGIDCELHILSSEKQTEAKKDYVEKVGANQTVAFGNGANDELMLKTAAIGIALIQDEGASAATLLSADIVMKNIHDALDLFLKNKRLQATLRT